MTLRLGITALGWIGFVVLGFLVIAHGLGYPDVHWVLAMPQMFEPAGSGASERITLARPAESEPKPIKSPRAAGRSASPQPHALPKRAAGTAGPARPASKRPAPLQLEWRSNPAALKPFTADTHYLSLPAYVRYVVHERTGRWISFQEAANMVREKTIPVEAAAVNP